MCESLCCVTYGRYVMWLFVSVFVVRRSIQLVSPTWALSLVTRAPARTYLTKNVLSLVWVAYCLLQHSALIDVHLVCFTRWFRDTIHARLKTFTLLCCRLIWAPCAKFYQNWLSFVDVMTKICWIIFWDTVYTCECYCGMKRLQQICWLSVWEWWWWWWWEAGCRQILQLCLWDADSVRSRMQTDTAAVLVRCWQCTADVLY